MTDVPTELRIISQDAKLDGHDKTVLTDAADMIEKLEKMVCEAQSYLLEARDRDYALQDRIMELTRQQTAIAAGSFIAGMRS